MIVLAGCGPGEPTELDAVDEDELLEASCSTFCSRVEECGGHLFPNTWGYTTVQECADYCVLWTRSTVIHKDDPECIDIMMQEWDCASALPTCYDFEWYEYATFGMTGLNNSSCGDEVDHVRMQCGK